MKIKKTECRCAKCGEAVQITRCISNYITERFIDGQPRYMKDAPQLQVCPKCGYTSLNIELFPSGNPYETAKHHQVLSWYAEWEGDTEKAHEERERMIEALEEGLKYNATESAVIVYIDTLRKMGQFEKAHEAVLAVKAEFEAHKDTNLTAYRIFQFEISLIWNRDMDPHSGAEVNV